MLQTEMSADRVRKLEKRRKLSLSRLIGDFRYWFFFLRPRKSDWLAMAGHIREFLRFRKERRAARLTIAEHVQQTLAKELEDIDDFM